jgi:hypothetical protein
MFIKATDYFYSCVNIKDGKLIGSSVKGLDKIDDLDAFIAGETVELKGTTKGLMRSLFKVVRKKDIEASKEDADKGDK